MGPIERKGPEDLAKSSATVVDQSNLGQAPRQGLKRWESSSAPVGSSRYCLNRVVEMARIFTYGEDGARRTAHTSGPATLLSERALTE